MNKKSPHRGRRLAAPCARSLRVATVVSVCLASLLFRSFGTQGQGPISEYGISEFEGFTKPRYDILVAATEIGRIAEVNVDVGDVIVAGQVVARLEDESQRAAVESSRFRAAMHGETDAAKAEAALAAVRLQQLERLASRDMARPDEVTRAAADLEIAKARQLAAAEQEKLRQLELKRYELQLERRSIVAPMSGVVAKVLHAPGEYLTPGDPAVIQLLNVETIYGVFSLPAKEAIRLRIGDRRSVYVASLRKSVDAVVHSISPAIDGESGTIEVRLAINNSNGELRVGDACRLSLGDRQASRDNTPRRSGSVRNASGSAKRVYGDRLLK